MNEELKSIIMSEELKPCSFCGGEVCILELEEINEESRRIKFRVACKNCLCPKNLYDTKAEAINAWNTRAELQNEAKK